ncbi:MAG: DUF899 domain-containing protein [Pseudonocardiaceae bacterium]|nr:MAG: DUF899 domain-containing protein [Pseudonocardiaceae bacterium]
MTTTPTIVDPQEWASAREELLVAEKEVRRALDAVAARRRRLPMTPVASCEFATPDGPRTLAELFDGHDRLVVYQFMDNGPDHFCPGCTWFTDNIPASAPQLLAENGVAFRVVSDMPLPQLDAYWARRDWALPYASSHGTSWTADTGAGGGFQLSAFLRVDDAVHLTYATTSRGIDGLTFTTGVLDLTAWGRGEEWEDSPQGWPQVPTAMIPTTMTIEGSSTSFGRFR